MRRTLRRLLTWLRGQPKESDPPPEDLIHLVEVSGLPACGAPSRVGALAARLTVEVATATCRPCRRDGFLRQIQHEANTR